MLQGIAWDTISPRNRAQTRRGCPHRVSRNKKKTKHSKHTEANIPGYDKKWNSIISLNTAVNGIMRSKTMIDLLAVIG